MLRIGDYNKLRVVKEVDFGMYLDGGEDYGEILIPTRYVPTDTKVDDVIDVFVYLDSEDRIIATTESPKVTVNHFAFLECVDVNFYGAFFDWGIPSKHLLVPGSEQVEDIEKGKSYLVYVYLDDASERIVGSTKLEKHTKRVKHELEEGQSVDLLIAQPFELGYKAVINGEKIGLIYNNEIFQELQIGDNLAGFVKKLREDGKIDLVLQKQGFELTDDFAKELYQELINLKELPFSDKSSPEEIKKRFKVSKKTFKKAIGQLYKKRMILIKEDKIILN